MHFTLAQLIVVDDIQVMEATNMKRTKREYTERMARIEKALATEAAMVSVAAKEKGISLDTWRGALRISYVTFGYDGLWVHTGSGLNASSFSLGNDGAWAKVMKDAGLERVAGWNG